MQNMAKLKNMIMNADEFPEETQESETEDIEVDYTFKDITETLKNFIHHYHRNYKFTYKFPELWRISEQIGGQKIADFKPTGIRYYNSRVKQQAVEFYKNTKFLDYFSGKVNLDK